MAVWLQPPVPILMSAPNPESWRSWVAERLHLGGWSLFLPYPGLFKEAQNFSAPEHTGAIRIKCDWCLCGRRILIPNRSTNHSSGTNHGNYHETLSFSGTCPGSSLFLIDIPRPLAMMPLVIVVPCPQWHLEISICRQNIAAKNLPPHLPTFFPGRCCCNQVRFEFSLAPCSTSGKIFLPSPVAILLMKRTWQKILHLLNTRRSALDQPSATADISALSQTHLLFMYDGFGRTIERWNSCMKLWRKENQSPSSYIWLTCCEGCVNGHSSIPTINQKVSTPILTIFPTSEPLFTWPMRVNIPRIPCSWKWWIIPRLVHFCRAYTTACGKYWLNPNALSHAGLAIFWIALHCCCDR